jgi:hypothetical protein
MCAPKHPNICAHTHLALSFHGAGHLDHRVIDELIGMHLKECVKDKVTTSHLEKILGQRKRKEKKKDK